MLGFRIDPGVQRRRVILELPQEKRERLVGDRRLVVEIAERQLDLSCERGRLLLHERTHATQAVGFGAIPR